MCHDVAVSPRELTGVYNGPGKYLNHREENERSRPRGVHLVSIHPMFIWRCLNDTFVM